MTKIMEEIGANIILWVFVNLTQITEESVLLLFVTVLFIRKEF